MSTAPGANDAASESTMASVSGSPPSDDHAMEVDKGAVGLPPTSPVSRGMTTCSLAMMWWGWRLA